MGFHSVEILWSNKHFLLFVLMQILPEAESKVLEAARIREKERGLSSIEAGERAARWLNSYVNSSEWTTREVRSQERGHDLGVKDLRVGKEALILPRGCGVCVKS